MKKQSETDDLIVCFGGAAQKKEPDKMLHGGKGASLLKMTAMGLKVPPGFTLTTESYRAYHKNPVGFKTNMKLKLNEALAHIEKAVGRKFGDSEDPLLVSVRSGAPVSMPGMMDTILNLGLNNENITRVAARQGDLFAWSSYLRLISQFTGLVLVPEKNDKELNVLLDMGRVPKTAKEARERCETALKKLEDRGTPFPQKTFKQLWAAIETVFGSWNNERAFVYRKLQNIPHDLGTACNIQAMVFGNRSEQSGTGVVFSRDPSTGAHGISGEYLPVGQGEDVVAGIRTPEPVKGTDPGQESLQQRHPELYKELTGTMEKLELQFSDVVDVEFTVEDGVMYFLQCRSAKRSAEAALQIATDFVEEGRINEDEAMRRVTPQQIASLLRPSFGQDDLKLAKTQKRELAKGLPAGPGAACGQICFEAEQAGAEPWILVRHETSPEDVKAMSQSAGVLTVHGGMSSHAALVARQLGIVAVVGCEAAEINRDAGILSFGKRTLKVGDWISIDGSTGLVYEGKIPTRPAALDNPHARRILKKADEKRTLKIHANADTGDQAARAREFGAEGIGLCRTEHMFFGEERLPLVQELILSRSEAEQDKALRALEKLQEQDFYEILLAMDGLPVTVRTIDPPLHEFLPKGEAEIKALAKRIGLSLEDTHGRINEMKENNPMLGFRGCRLGIIHPAIPKMQIWALSAAAAKLKKEGKSPRPEIMIPLTSTARELQIHRQALEEEILKTEEKQGIELSIPIGTMIEVPRAALVASEIAKYADFLSFGTNDLTQLTFGISRDDASAFLPQYLEQDIYETDPFVSLDEAGVGALMAMTAEGARSTKPDIKIGICGEHGGDPSSIAFCQKIGLNYVSCSPYRVPVARLAAGQVARG